MSAGKRALRGAAFAIGIVMLACLFAMVSGGVSGFIHVFTGWDFETTRTVGVIATGIIFCAVYEMLWGDE